MCLCILYNVIVIKKRLWNNKHLSGWKFIRDFFERIEFQNRGAAHLHIVLWTEATIEEMIASNEIRSTIPNPENKPQRHLHIKCIPVDLIYVEVLHQSENNENAISLDHLPIEHIMTQHRYITFIKQ